MINKVDFAPDILIGSCPSVLVPESTVTATTVTVVGGAHAGQSTEYL